MNHVRFFLVVLFLVSLGFPACASSDANIVANGDFTTPYLPSFIKGYARGSSLGAWTVDSGGVDVVSEKYWNPPKPGTQCVDLDSTIAGSIAQDLATTPGTVYVLQFAASGNPEGPPTIKKIGVYWDGQLVDTVSVDTTGFARGSVKWKYFRYPGLSATAEKTRLRFASLAGTGYGPAIGDVQVVPASGADLTPLSAATVSSVSGQSTVSIIASPTIGQQQAALTPVQQSGITGMSSDSGFGSLLPVIGLCAVIGVIAVVLVARRGRTPPAPADAPPVQETPLPAPPSRPPVPETAPVPPSAPPEPVLQSPASTTQNLPAELSDRYTESRLIGRGGFARVYKARRRDGQWVAVKMPITLDASTGKSFIAEIQNWTKLNHPNIVKVFDFNIMPMPYFEMELCDGSLADMQKPLDCRNAAWIIFNICEGLKFTHRQKIIHRDLKPQNILMKNGVPKISDWGLSKVVTESASHSSTSFTPSYAAPEQLSTKAKDERTDIWQLGVILYELVTGTLPFTGEGMMEIAVNIATKEPKHPSTVIPATKGIEPIILKCLEKVPGNRYGSVMELQKALSHFLGVNPAESIRMDMPAPDSGRSGNYCGDLVVYHLKAGDISAAYTYASDLVNYAKGDLKSEAEELSGQIRIRMENHLVDIPEDLIQKAEVIVHKIKMGFKKL